MTTTDIPQYMIDPVNGALLPASDTCDPELIPVTEENADLVAEQIVRNGTPDSVEITNSDHMTLRWSRMEEGRPLMGARVISEGYPEEGPLHYPVEEEERTSPQYSYWDYFTEPEIPWYERAAAGALLPAVAVLSLPACGGEEAAPGQAPVIDPIPDREVMASRSLSLTVSASDGDDNDTLTWTVSHQKNPDEGWDYVLPEGATFEADDCEYNSCHFNGESLADGTLNWEPTEGQVGSYEFRFEISDGDLSDVKTNRVEVTSYVSPGGGGGGGGGSRPPSASRICPHIAINSNGDRVVAWVERGSSSGGPSRIKLASNPSLGGVVTGGTEIYTPSSSDMGAHPLLCSAKRAVTLSNDGEVEVCFQMASGAINCRRVTPEGEEIFPRQIAVDNADTGFSMDQFSDGTFPIVWSEEDEVYYRLMARSGFPDSDPISVGDGRMPDISADGDRFAVLWQDGTRLQFKRSNVGGTALTGEAGSPTYGTRTLSDSDLHNRASISLKNGLVAISRIESNYYGPSFSVFSPGNREIISRGLELGSGSDRPSEIGDTVVAIDSMGHIKGGFIGRMGAYAVAFGASVDNFWEAGATWEDLRTFTSDWDTDYFMVGMASNGAQAVLADGYNTWSTFSSSDKPIYSEDLGDFPTEPVISDTPVYDGPNGITINFEDETIGETASDDFYIENRGRSTLILTRQELTPPFSAPSSIYISALNAAWQTVTFTPTAVGDVEGVVRYTTNDPETPEVIINLFGHGGN